jgi:adenine-specific DNA-methyltransferase
MLKSFLDESGPGMTPHTWWDHGFAGHNKEATLEMKALFDGASPFDTPKPVKLMTRLLELAAGPDSLVLDFFAGSCSMAQAVMKKNAEDGLRRRFIMVQMPEPLPPQSPWIGKGYRTIADIGRDRIRRAGARIAHEGATDTLDIGFRALRVDTSGMKDVFYTPAALKQEDLPAHADHIKEDRTGDDLLFQVLVDWGVDLSLPVKKQDMGGKCVYFVDGNALAACFDDGIDEDLVVEIARHKPRKAVFRDGSYADDNTKINVVQHFRILSPGTEVRTL